ncbi:hypothetical protein Ahy_B01g054106 [Arachis hypogaea]|uniref:4Fe-4S ferredoxin-type domain-containing protein n=1 Tax=Arachis hypogaea TaxID=3818 RepID=A0A445ATA4_ARAHY|nr:hypothetical protein Ahy_B01g054106 [Arachis hypogaea]
MIPWNGCKAKQIASAPRTEDCVGCKRCESAYPTDFLSVRVYLWLFSLFIQYPRFLSICNLIHKLMGSIRLAICCVLSTISTEGGKMMS